MPTFCQQWMFYIFVYVQSIHLDGSTLRYKTIKVESFAFTIQSRKMYRDANTSVFSHFYLYK